MTIKGDIIRLRQQYPRLSATSIANGLGVTREYVGQVLRKAYAETKAICYNPDVRTLKVCSRCGYRSRWLRKSGVCTICNRESRYIKLICSNCGKGFLRLKSGVLNSQRNAVARGVVPDLHRFCSRNCQGYWAVSHRRARHNLV